MERWTLFGKQEKYEKAANLFKTGGNALEVEKRWDEAAEAFLKAAGVYNELREESDASEMYKKAAQCFRKSTQHDRAVSIYEDYVIPPLSDAGQHSQVGKLYQEIAEMFEEDGEIASAMDAYRKSADRYLLQANASAASKCQVKLATLAGQEGNYDLAIDLFEAVADNCLKTNLLKFNAKQYYLNAALCVLAKGDLVLIERKIAQYKELDYTFPGTRECKLVEDIARAFSELNVEMFTDIVYEYDRVTKLDPWKTTILLRIKTKLSAMASEAVDVT